MQDDERSQLPRRAKLWEPPALPPLGVAELQSYIAELRAEIIRVEAEIARKDGHRSAADEVFRFGKSSS